MSIALREVFLTSPRKRDSHSLAKSSGHFPFQSAQDTAATQGQAQPSAGCLQGKREAIQIKEDRFR